MAQISDIEQRVLDRLEEGSATFWDLEKEIRVFIVEAMNEATLITGEPQIRASAIYTIPASTVFTPLQLPADALALLRVEGAGSLPVQKAWMWDLDKQYPGWETATGDVPLYWVPFGLTQFGIYPNLTADAQVVLNYVQTPVNTARPYTGAEPIPFQQEFIDGLEDGASHLASIKEAGTELTQSMDRYQRFLTKMQALSNFAYRKNDLRFSRSLGASADINEARAR